MKHIQESQIIVMTGAQLKEFAAEVARATLAERDAEPTLKKAGETICLRYARHQ